MDSGLRTWANETIRERLEAVEKDLPGPLEEIEIYLRSEGVDVQLPRKRPPSKPAAAQDRIYTPDGLGRVLKHRRGGLPIVNR